MSITTESSPVSFSWPKRSLEWTWHDIVRHALTNLGGRASLRDLYRVIRRHPRTKALEHWQPKVRQTLQASPLFVRLGNGVWGLSAGFSERQVVRFERRRRERWPLRSRDGADS
jgi:hypothetical protein